MQNAAQGWRLPLVFGFCLFVFGAAFFHVSGVDVGFHIRTGAHILETGAIPCRNTFSFTQPDQPWLCQQWWPGVLFALVFGATGVAGLIVLKALFTVGMFLLATVHAASGDRDAAAGASGANWLAALAAATAAVCLARVRFFIRPFMLSGLFFALLGLLDSRYDRRWRWHAIGLPILMACWANTHAGVMYGFVYLVVRLAVSVATLGLDCVFRRSCSSPAVRYGLIRQCRQRTAGIVLGVIASVVSVHVINPSGAQVLLLPLTYFADPFWHSLIVEFRGMTWRQDPGFFVAVVALGALQLATRHARRPELAAVCWVFAALTLRSQRCVLFFALAAVPYAAAMLRTFIRSVRARGVAAGHALLALLWVSVTALVFVPDRTRPFGIGVGEYFHPLGVYAFMRATVPPQRVFNNMAYGAGMLWWLYPEFPPFIDGRCEAYSKTFWRDVYRPVERGDPGWRDVFARYGVTGALLYTGEDYAELRLARQLHADFEWALVAFDDGAQLYLRRTPENAAVIAAHAYRRLWPGGAPVAVDGPEDARVVRDEATRALRVAPRCRYARLSLARAELVLGDWAAAAAHYADFLATPGLHADARIWRDYGYALYRADQLARADRVLARVEDDPECRVPALHLRHLIAAARGDTDAADRLIRRAHALAGADAEVTATYEAWMRRGNEGLSDTGGAR